MTVSAELLVRTKVGVPPPDRRTDARSRLVSRITEGTRGPLTLVSVPAGFGKTTVVSVPPTSSKRRG